MDVSSSNSTDDEEKPPAILDDEDDDSGGETDKWPQILAAISATLGGFGLGLALSWTSPALIRMDETLCVPNDDCDITGVSDEEASWIGSVLSLGAMASGPATAFLLSAVGRKWTMVWYSVPMAVGFALFIVAGAIDDVILIYVGRVLTGFAGGAFNLAVPVYLTEVAETSLRGALSISLNFVTTSGQLFVNGLNINNAVSWEVISAISIAVPVLLFISMSFMPESPRFHLEKGRDAEALASLRRLRGSRYDPSLELKRMKEDHRTKVEAGSVTPRELLTRAIYVRPFWRIMALMFFQQFAGINVVMFYTQEIFEKAGTDLDTGLSAFLVTIPKALGALMSIFLVERFGRVTLMFVSEALMCLCLFPLGAYFFLQENSCLARDAPPECSDARFSDDTVDSLGWLPLVCLVLYVFCFALGMGPIPWTYNVEVLPLEARSLGATSAFTFNWFCTFVVTKFQVEMEHAMGLSGCYFLYGSSCAVGAAFVLIFLPETKSKTPEEVRTLFVNK